MMRKLVDVTDDEAFAAEMQSFGRALHSAGYATREDIIKLIREVKVEQAEDWAKDND